MTDESDFHMTPEAFRQWGHELVDWIADYQRQVEHMAVQSPVQPGQVRASLPPQPPDQPEDFKAIFAEFKSLIVPGLTHWQSPHFRAYFPANNSGPSILGELLSAGLGVQGMLWSTSPACTELEALVLDWIVDLLQLPLGFKSSSAGGGVIQDSASSAVLCALVAARERATNHQTNQAGCTGKLVAYASTQAHSSVEKAVKIAGIGRTQLRLIDTCEDSAMSSEGLARQIRSDKAAGLQPFFVTASLGTTASNAFDPLPEIGPLCREEGLWLHVDAAMSGTAAICPEFRWIHRGLDWADSYCFNPHKWMFTNFDCDCFYVASRADLINALSILPDYLRNQATESGAVIDYRDWQVPLGRRFRSLKLWFVIRSYGRAGLQHHIRRHVAMAQELASLIERSPLFDLLAPVRLNLVCFAHRGGDEATDQMLRRLNESGRIFLSHARIQGRLGIRFCVGQTHTARRHLEEDWALINRIACEVT